ncbi:MAG: hypothetical protein R2865_02175 [Deinococcales bacterium]
MKPNHHKNIRLKLKEIIDEYDLKINDLYTYIQNNFGDSISIHSLRAYSSGQRQPSLDNLYILLKTLNQLTQTPLSLNDLIEVRLDLSPWKPYNGRLL